RRSYQRKLERGEDDAAQRIADRVKSSLRDDDDDFDFGFSDDEGMGDDLGEDDDEDDEDFEDDE
ncbi:hypothetical protein HDU99_008317, partial [Rhizoclosmatium hyalinum]